MGTMIDTTPAEMIRDYLVAGGRHTLFNNWTFKIGKMPSEPDMCIVLIDQGGPPSFPHLLLDIQGLQILVRGERAGASYKSSSLMVRKIRDILLGLDGHPAEFTELDGITERAQPVSLGHDDKDRHIWSWNANLFIEPESNPLTHRESL